MNSPEQSHQGHMPQGPVYDHELEAWTHPQFEEDGERIWTNSELEDLYVEPGQNGFGRYTETLPNGVVITDHSRSFESVVKEQAPVASKTVSVDSPEAESVANKVSTTNKNRSYSQIMADIKKLRGEAEVDTTKTKRQALVAELGGRVLRDATENGLSEDAVAEIHEQIAEELGDDVVKVKKSSGKRTRQEVQDAVEEAKRLAEEGKSPALRANSMDEARDFGRDREQIGTINTNNEEAKLLEELKAKNERIQAGRNATPELVSHKKTFVEIASEFKTALDEYEQPEPRTIEVPKLYNGNPLVINGETQMTTETIEETDQNIRDKYLVELAGKIVVNSGTTDRKIEESLIRNVEQMILDAGGTEEDVEAFNSYIAEIRNADAFMQEFAENEVKPALATAVAKGKTFFQAYKNEDGSLTDFAKQIDKKLSDEVFSKTSNQAVNSYMRERARNIIDQTNYWVDEADARARAAAKKAPAKKAAPAPTKKAAPTNPNAKGDKDKKLEELAGKEKDDFVQDVNKLGFAEAKNKLYKKLKELIRKKDPSLHGQDVLETDEVQAVLIGLTDYFQDKQDSNATVRPSKRNKTTTQLKSKHDREISKLKAWIKKQDKIFDPKKNDDLALDEFARKSFNTRLGKLTRGKRGITPSKV